MARCSAQHNPLAERSRSSSLVNFLGAGARMAVEGAEGLGITSQEATLVLQASWFNRSSCNRTKEMAAISVFGCGLVGFFWAVMAGVEDEEEGVSNPEKTAVKSDRIQRKIIAYVLFYQTEFASKKQHILDVNFQLKPEEIVQNFDGKTSVQMKATIRIKEISTA
ncbi:hypothetical protein GW17_00017944 [Ensete ventricosum]|nr:hypothetical protein GW17_00017944 [Ensete ventricosum]